MSLPGDAGVVEFTVPGVAKIENNTMEQALDEGLVGDEMLVVGIERDGDVLTPKGKPLFRSEMFFPCSQRPL